MPDEEHKLLIDGVLCASLSGVTEPAVSPATEETLALTPVAAPEDAQRALDAAHLAWQTWRRTPLTRRVACLRELAEVLREHSEELARLESRDLGNPIRVTRQDLRVAAETVDYFANLATEMKGSTVPADTGGWHFTMREPFGVVVRIAAFNHPLLFASKIAAPLVAGNTLVLKPAPQAQLSVLRLASLIKDVFPPGVVNVVNGAGDVGAALVADSRVRRVGVVGSVQTGRAVQAVAAQTLSDVTLELGGKNPLIVFPDADVGNAAAAAVRAMNFQWQGQSCGSASRLFVHEDVYDETVAGVVEIVESLQLGDPLEESTDMGPLVSLPQWQKVEGSVTRSLKDGAQLLAGGRRPPGKQYKKGFWWEPTVLGGVRQEMSVARDEIFGPVLSILAWVDEESLMEQVNSTDYGLTANLWTRDIDTALRIIPELTAGYCYVNGATQHFLGLPFGGYRDSGRGREESLDELLSYSQLKSISVLPHG